MGAFVEFRRRVGGRSRLLLVCLPLAAQLPVWSASCRPSGDATPDSAEPLDGTDGSRPPSDSGVANEEPWGAVVIATHAGPSGPFGYVSAGFVAPGTVVAATLLEEVAVGECVFRLLLESDSPVPGLDVGVVSVAGLTGPGPIQIDPICAGPWGCSYDFNYQGDDLFSPGAAVVASAPGATAPGFSVSSTAPQTLLLLEPALAGADSVSDLGFVGGEPFQVRWVPLGAAPVHVSLANSLVESPRAHITCEAVDDGDLVIDGDLTARLAVFDPRSFFAARREQAGGMDVQLWISYVVGVYYL